MSLHNGREAEGAPAGPEGATRRSEVREMYSGQQPQARPRSSFPWLIVIVVTVGVVVVGCGVLAALMYPLFKAAGSEVEVAVVKAKIYEDYERLWYDQPIPKGPMYNKSGPLYDVANRFRELLRDLEIPANEYDEAVELIGGWEGVYEPDTYRRREEYDNVRELLTQYSESDKIYFEKYFAVVDKHKPLVRGAAGDNSAAKELVEAELRSFHSLQIVWGHQLDVDERMGELYLKRLDLLWKHRSHVIRDRDGYATLAPRAGSAVMSELDLLDDELSEVWEGYERLEGQKGMPS